MTNTGDKIVIERLEVFAHHGVFEFEKENGQYFYISTAVFLDLQGAGTTDDLNRSVSYADMCQDITDYASAHTFDLIEKVAEQLAIMLLDKYPLIQKVELTVSKPEAPIDQKASDLSVSIVRQRHTAFIAYGSNMGDSQKIIEEALEKIKNHPYCALKQQSTTIITKPYGGVEQDDFYNGVIELETFFEPYNLLEFLNQLEQEAGRERLVHWGPRTLDLDIILYDDIVENTKRLTIPHPDMRNRAFVLEPMNEIAGYIYHPVYHKTIADMLKELNN